MYFAVDKDGNRVNILFANEEEKYYCPGCGQEVIQRRGNTNCHHFAHMNCAEDKCDDWSYDMSDWHRDWQDRFPSECQEVVVVRDGVKHRADVLIDNTVIEFQHSRMLFEEFSKRNEFYTGAGYTVVWLFDMTDEYDADRITMLTEEYKYKWNYHWHTFDEFYPNKEKQITVYFQFLSDESDESYGIEKLVWMAPTRQRFITQNGLALSHKEFVELFIRADESESASDERKGFNIGDVFDALIEVDDSYYPCFKKESRWECFENCNCCPFSTAAIDQDALGVRFQDLYSAKQKQNTGTVSGCLFRFRDILEGWEPIEDKVLDVQYDDEYRVTHLTVLKGGVTIERNYEPCEKVCKSIPEILRESNAKVVGILNIKTGTKAKVANSDRHRSYNVNSVSGYLGLPDGRGYCRDRRDIFFWKNKEWIREWERGDRSNE